MAEGQPVFIKCKRKQRRSISNLKFLLDLPSKPIAEFSHISHLPLVHCVRPPRIQDVYNESSNSSFKEYFAKRLFFQPRKLCKKDIFLHWEQGHSPLKTENHQASWSSLKEASSLPKKVSQKVAMDQLLMSQRRRVRRNGHRCTSMFRLRGKGGGAWPFCPKKKKYVVPHPKCSIF